MAGTNGGFIDQRVNQEDIRKTSFLDLLRPNMEINAAKALVYATAFAVFAVGVGSCNYLGDRNKHVTEQQRIDTIKIVAKKYSKEMTPTQFKDYLQSLGLIDKNTD